MPTYEYRCKECGEHLEAVQAFSDDPLTECTNCGGSLRKVFNSVGISFKGTGFYKNDSRSTSSSSGSSTDVAASTSSGSSSDSSGSGSSSDSSGSSSSSSTTSTTKTEAAAG